MAEQFIYKIYGPNGQLFGTIGPITEARLLAERIGGTVGEAVFTGGIDVDIFEDVGQSEQQVGVTLTDVITPQAPYTKPVILPVPEVSMNGDNGHDDYVSVTTAAEEAGLAFPFMGAVGAGTAITRFAPAIAGLSWKQTAAYLLGFIGLESLVPGDVIPIIPGVEQIVSAGQSFRGALQDQLPGGFVPGERKANQALMAALSSVAGVEITAMTHMDSGAFMGSYYPSPGARKKRGVYIGPGGSPVRTWANRGHAVISRDPRGSSLGKGAAALQKATSRYIKADRVSDRIKKRVKTRRKG